MSQEVPPDLEIPTLTQTLPGHWRTRPLEIPWITERAPKIDPGKPLASPLELDGANSPLSPDSSQSHGDENAIVGEALATDATANSLDASECDLTGALQSQEADIARWVNQVIQATAQSKTTGEVSAHVPPPDTLADEVVERVQARLNHMLPNLVQEVMDEIHQNPSPRGKPSDDVEMK